MTEDQNKKIAAWLWLCWHNTEVITRVNGNLDLVCVRCLTVSEEPEDLANVPFDTWDGFRSIMENGPKQEWWYEFMISICADYRQHPLSHEVIYYIPSNYIGPKLAETLIEWVERSGWTGREEMHVR